MTVTLYTIHCPKCKVLEKKLSLKGVSFTIVDDEEEVVRVGKEHKILSAPILCVNNEFMDFTASVKWLNTLK